MLSGKLLSVGGHDLRTSHLLVVGILALSFSISFMIRMQGTEHGFELNEFDPYFNYRATQYIVDNGVEAYFEWDDELSWYPHGRNVSETSQRMLHLTGAYTYWIFGGDSSLYDFTIMFPVVFGSLSTIAIFALVRVIGGTTAGLIASILFSVSLPALVRGPVGWFKSEPLGMFLTLVAMYLLVSGMTAPNRRVALAKVAAASVFTVYAVSSWGGGLFLFIPIGVFFLALPFLRDDHRFLLAAAPLYTGLVVALSPLVGRDVQLMGMAAMGLSTAFLVACILVQRRSGPNAMRNGLIVLVAFLAAGGAGAAAVAVAGPDLLPQYRYLNALNPFLTSIDPLTDSVSEHSTPSIEQSFLFHSVLAIFAGIGIWILIRTAQKGEPFVRHDMLFFALIFGISGAYVSSTFVRLELFASASVVMLSSIGIAFLLRNFLRRTPGAKQPPGRPLKVAFTACIIVLLMIPLVHPQDSTIFVYAKNPPTIFNGGAPYAVTVDDWFATFEWIRENTPPDAVIASWWDYGYWIQTLGERASLADNSTRNSKIIAEIARMFMNSPDEAWRMLQQMQADYVLIFVSAAKLDVDSPVSLYTLGSGADESKKQWFIRIGGLDEREYIHRDNISGTDKFWDETLLAQMFPYSLLTYVNPARTSEQSPEYVPGMIGIYEKDLKYPADGDGPLQLAYSSPSFEDESLGQKLTVLVYKVNHDYVPAPVEIPVEDGTMEDDAADDGAMDDAMDEGTMEDGTMESDAMEDGTMQNGTATRGDDGGS